MYTKTLILSVAIALVCVPLANCLTCYQCVNPADCKKPRKVTCSIGAANETSNYLSVYHDNVRPLNSYRFDCLALTYTYPNNNSVVHQLHGCVHPDLAACYLPLKSQYGNWRKSKCTVCSGNKCNKSPAGKMSSSLYTLAGTLLALMLVKKYA